MNGFKVLKAQIISELDNLRKLLDEAADVVEKGRSWLKRVQGFKGPRVQV